MSSNDDHTRALRYRRLALAQADKGIASLLNQLAEEADRGTLCTANLRRDASVRVPNSPVKNETVSLQAFKRRINELTA